MSLLHRIKLSNTQECFRCANPWTLHYWFTHGFPKFSTSVRLRNINLVIIKVFNIFDIISSDIFIDALATYSAQYLNVISSISWLMIVKHLWNQCHNV